MKVTFLGATGTVTGSKYGIRHGDSCVLVDCGLFQGYKQLRLRNWAPLPVAATSFSAAILTHAHIDHSGYLPLLARQGFKGPVYCTDATAALCEILLRDSAHLQEEEAAYANRHGYSKHSPALPLYTRDDAEAALRLLRPVGFDTEFAPAAGVTVRLSPAGHILGAALVSMCAGGRTLVFSGDLGRPNDRIMRPPAAVRAADWLVLESTYGDRRHEPSDPLDTLREVIARTVARGGVVIVPSFAVGRAQALLHHLTLLKAAGALRPEVRVYLDSPMAADVTDLYIRHHSEHRLTASQCQRMCEIARFVRTPEESRELDRSPWPMVIIAASGMATGGRVLHHLARFVPDPRNTILLTGFQAGGTRGASLLGGAKEIKIHGAYVAVRAEVAMIENLSAHADYAETIDWLRLFERAPARVFLTHGEPAAADMLRRRIAEALGWRCEVPEYLESAELSR